MAGDTETDVSWYYSLVKGQAGGEGGRGEGEVGGGGSEVTNQEKTRERIQ